MVCRFRSPLRICVLCQSLADDQLAALPVFYTRLEGVLEPGSGGSDRVSGSKLPPLPARLGPLSLRGPGGIVGVLTAWEDDWRSWLGWSARPFRGSVEQTVGGAVVFLRNNWLWASAEHPSPDVFAADVRALTAACRSELEPRGNARRIGLCPTVVDEGRCGVELWADPYAPEIRCWRCRTTWGRDRWLNLASAMR
jgi:hypothetical protein